MNESSIKALALGMSLETIDLMIEMKNRGFETPKGDGFFEGLTQAKEIMEGFVKFYEERWGNLAPPLAPKKEEGKWMVYDDESEDEIYHDTLEKAEKDYSDALRDVSEGSKVIMFKVVKEEFKSE